MEIGHNMLGKILYEWSPEKDLIELEKAEILDLKSAINDTTTFEAYDLRYEDCGNCAPDEIIANLLVKYLEKEKLLICTELDICAKLSEYIQFKSNKGKYRGDTNMLRLIDAVATKYGNIWNNYISKITLVADYPTLKKYAERLNIEMDTLSKEYSPQFNEYIQSCGINDNCEYADFSTENKIAFNKLFARISHRYAAIINDLGDRIKVIDNISENKNVSKEKLEILIDILKSFNCAVTLYKSVLTIMLIIVDVQTSTIDKPKRTNFLSILNKN